MLTSEATALTRDVQCTARMSVITMLGLGTQYCSVLARDEAG